MKICYLADANSIHTKKLCNYFVSIGYDMTVISLNKGEIPGVKVYSMDMEIENDGAIYSKFAYLNKLGKIKKIIKDIKPDIVHAHYASSYGLFAAIVNYKPTIVSVWGSDIYDFPKKSYIHKSIIKFNLKKADCILSTSNIMKKETEKYTDKEIIVTPFGVNVEKFKPLEDKKDNSGEIVIGTIKSLEEKYGINYLIRAFKIVTELNPKEKLRLVIAGKGSRLEELKNLCKELNISDIVDFIGHISQDEVVKTFQSFDVAVFPSILDSESFGVAAVEAQACGIPVVVSAVDGLLESTVPNVTSLVAEKMSAEDLAEKINILVKDKDLREKMGADGRNNVLEKYNVIDNFNIIDDVYKSFVK